MDARDKILAEIVDTEKRYLDGLKTLQNTYINPLQKMGYLVNSKEFTLIVSTLTMIINVNSVLLKNLESNNLSMQFGKLFQTFAPFLKIYTQYTNGYDSAINIVRTLRQNDKKAHETIYKMEKQSIANGNLDFKSYLILPVQRIPRYNLLISELLKKTDPIHPDYDNIKSALEKTVIVAEHINKAMKVVENRNKMVEIKRKLFSPNDAYNNVNNVMEMAANGTGLEGENGLRLGSATSAILSPNNASSLDPKPKHKKSFTKKNDKSKKKSGSVLSTPSSPASPVTSSQILEDADVSSPSNEHILMLPEDIIQPFRRYKTESLVYMMTPEIRDDDEFFQQPEGIPGISVERYLYLFSDLLLICKKPSRQISLKSVKSSSSNSANGSPVVSSTQTPLSIEDEFTCLEAYVYLTSSPIAWVRDLSSATPVGKTPFFEIENYFQLVTGSKTYTFKVANKDIKLKWIKKLNKVIDELKRKEVHQLEGKENAPLAYDPIPILYNISKDKQNDVPLEVPKTEPETTPQELPTQPEATSIVEATPVLETTTTAVESKPVEDTPVVENIPVETPKTPLETIVEEPAVVAEEPTTTEEIPVEISTEISTSTTVVEEIQEQETDATVTDHDTQGQLKGIEQQQQSTTATVTEEPSSSSTTVEASTIVEETTTEEVVQEVEPKIEEPISTAEAVSLPEPSIVEPVNNTELQPSITQETVTETTTEVQQPTTESVPSETIIMKQEEQVMTVPSSTVPEIEKQPTKIEESVTIVPSLQITNIEEEKPNNSTTTTNTISSGRRNSKQDQLSPKGLTSPKGIVASSPRSGVSPRGSEASKRWSDKQTSPITASSAKKPTTQESEESNPPPWMKEIMNRYKSNNKFKFTLRLFEENKKENVELLTQSKQNLGLPDEEGKTLTNVVFSTIENQLENTNTTEEEPQKNLTPSNSEDRRKVVTKSIKMVEREWNHIKEHLKESEESEDANSTAPTRKLLVTDIVKRFEETKSASQQPTSARNKKGGHSFDYDLIKRWRKPVIGLAAIHVLWTMVLFEDYQHNYHQNKAHWAYYKQHRGAGAVPPYQVRYSTDRVKTTDIEVLWHTFKKDVQ